MKKAFCLVCLSVALVTMVAMNSIPAYADGSAFESAFGSAFIKNGDYNNNVILLHQKLSDLGIFKLRAESPYGPQSESAVRALQGAIGKEKTGVISTGEELNEILSLDHIDVKIGWEQDDKGWKYYEGSAVSNCWQLVGGKWYRFDADGYMLANTWFEEDGKSYWLEPSGARATSKWVQLDGIWYYLKADGTMAVSEYIDNYWIDEQGHWIEGGKAE